jgi:uncharacterized membrane protein YedE/YeeE
MNDSNYSKDMEIKAKPYWNPYVAGIGLGLVLLSAFVIMGHGLGASGAFSSLTAFGVLQVAPEHASNNIYYADFLEASSNPLKEWLVIEVIGVLIGGYISGKSARRIRLVVEKGPGISNRSRLFYAFLGGILMAIGAKLARGCTSGQALTGGALLSLGSWTFMMAVFIGGYAFAYIMRRQWR